MRNLNVLLTSAVTGALALGFVATTAQAAEKVQMEKCYGIVKAGKNDCQTSTTACAGTATKDAQKDAWIFLPKGTCDKIVGGQLASAKK
ncbi:MAG TPA: DUF2282 domain-containing protein [Sulfuricaulis sp.]|nr:DUF2282 domain-containing protein [Sulfuricaulis sp.]